MIAASTTNMSKDLKFQQRWEFRRRDSDLDSSSDNSKSCSSVEPVLKKHKLVSSLLSPENVDTSGTPRSQQGGDSDPSSGDQFKIGKANKKCFGSSKKDNLDSKVTKKDSLKKVDKKKSKSNAYDPALLDDFKIFVESLLEDLKVSRENLFVWMREEMHKLMPAGTNSQSAKRGGRCRQVKVQVQHQNNFVLGLEAQSCKGGSLEKCVKRTTDSTARLTKRKGCNGQENIQVQCHAILGSDMKNCNHGSLKQSLEGEKEVGSGTHPTRGGQGNGLVQHQYNIEVGLELQNCNDRFLEKSTKSHRIAGSSIPCEVTKDQVDQAEAIGPLTSTEKNKGEMVDLSATKPKFLSNPCDQVATAMYLTLPTVLPEPPYGNYGLDSSFCNYIQPEVAGNKMAVTSERSNLVPSASICNGNFLGIQQEDKIASFSQLGSRNVNSIDQNSIPTSSFSSGFPIPLHQGLNGCFNIPNQVGLDNLPQENSILGLRMNAGAISFSSGNNVFPEHFVANHLRTHLNYKADEGIMAFQTPDLKDSHLFQNYFNGG